VGDISKSGDTRVKIGPYDAALTAVKLPMNDGLWQNNVV